MQNGTQLRKLSRDELPKARRQEYVRADVCVMCEGKLKGPEGTYCETMYDDGKVIFAVAICRACKLDELEHGSRLPKSRPAKRSPKSSREYPNDGSNEDTDR